MSKVRRPGLGRPVLIVAGALLLTACTSPFVRQPAPTDAPPVLRSIMTADFPIREALRNFDSHAHHFVLSGVTAQGEHIRVRFTITPRGRSVFEGKSATDSRLSYVVERDGDTIAQAVYMEYTALGDGAMLGSAGDKRYIVVNSGGLLPAQATYGARGTYFRANEYASVAKGAIVQTHVARYSVERGDDANNSHARLCLRYETSGNSSVETHCFRVDRSGAITDPQIRFATPGLQITLR